MNVTLHSQNLQQKTEEKQSNNSDLILIVDNSNLIFQTQLDKLTEPLERYEFERDYRLKDSIWLLKRMIGLFMPKLGYIINVEPYYT